MDSGTDQTHYDKVFKLLEPQSDSTEAAFRQCRLKLLKFFSWRGCDDAASLADETIVRLLTNVDHGGLVLSGKPYSYVYGIAMNIFYEYKRDREKHPPILDEDNVRASTVAPDDDCRELCLRKLSTPKRKLLSEYYDGTDRDKLAGRLELTPNALRLKIHRIKQELRGCCEACEKRSAH